MTVITKVERPLFRSMFSSVIRTDVITRFLTTLVESGSMSYAFAATLVSGTEITLTVYPTSGTQGLPTGAPSVTDNKWR